jgi:hypothetical protein
MKRRDPMIAANAHVKSFAKSNHLRSDIREDGELVLLLGPRRARPTPLGTDGRAFPLDSHASFGLRAGIWTLFVGPTTPRKVNVVVARWESLGLAPHGLDFEAWVDVVEDRLLEVAEAHPLTRPQRRRQLSAAARVTALEQLAALRRPAATPAPPWEGTSGGENRPDGSGTRSEPSAPGPAAASPSADEVRP